MTREICRRDALRLAGLTAGALLAGGAASTAQAVGVRVAGAAQRATAQLAEPAVPPQTVQNAQIPQTVKTEQTAEIVKPGEPKASNAAVSPDREAWKYVKIDPEAVAKVAYENYEVGRCMYATFKAVVLSVADELAKTDPIAADAIYRFPYHITRYGDSGANGWGSLCGSLNGAMAAISLFADESKTRHALCDEIAEYYERTLLPIYKPEGDDAPYPQTIANSILCHISSGKWSALAQVRVDSPERTERCKRLSADVARKTAEILNLNAAALTSADVKPVVEMKRPEPTATCVGCHDKKGTNANAIGKWTCSECHTDKTPNHSAQ